MQAAAAVAAVAPIAVVLASLFLLEERKVTVNREEMRQTFESQGAQEGLPVYFPSRPLSTDNAAMIAAAAYPKWLSRDFAAMDFSAEAGMQLRGKVTV